MQRIGPARTMSKEFVPSDPAASPPTAIPEPLSAIFREHYAFVWRTVHRFGVTPAQADDAVQDVFVILYRRRSDWTIGHSPRALLFGIARRVAKAYRKKATRPSPETVPDAELPEAPGGGVSRWEAAQLVRDFLEQLDEIHRAVFILAELEGMAAPEIAEALGGVNLNTVYTRLRAARTQFARAVKRHQAREARTG